MAPLPILLLNPRPGIIDLGWGLPDPNLLPVDAVQRAVSTALRRFGPDTLEYGCSAGPGPLLDWLITHINSQEGRMLTADEIMITGGNSFALDLILSNCTKPNDTVIVESPTYHLAIQILRNHPLNLIPVPTDNDGIVVDALAGLLRELKRVGRQACALYTIPTFSNPTGVSLSDNRRKELVELASTEALLIIEDDVYRDLAYDLPASPSLWSIDPSGTTVRMGSFSKSLAPGLRLGWLTASRSIISRIVGCGQLTSGGGTNHFTAMVVAMLCEAGDFDISVAQLRKAYQAKRDALVSVLREQLPEEFTFVTPAGGFFVWVRLPPYLSSRQLLPHAEAAGVSFVPGPEFHLDKRGDDSFRLAFSYYSPKELAQAAKRLGYSIRKLID